MEENVPFWITTEKQKFRYDRMIERYYVSNAADVALKSMLCKMCFCPIPDAIIKRAYKLTPVKDKQVRTSVIEDYREACNINKTCMSLENPKLFGLYTLGQEILFFQDIPSRIRKLSEQYEGCCSRTCLEIYKIQQASKKKK